jgi:spore germination protein GerM
MLESRRRLVALVAGSMALVGCGIPVDRTAEELPNLDAVMLPTTTTSAPDTPMTTERATRGVIVYFVRGEGLVGRAAVVDAEYSAGDLVAMLVVGPTSEDAANGLRSGIERRADLIEGISTEGDLVVVDLAAALSDLPGIEQVLIIGQITLTLVANLAVQGVVFQQGGQPVAVPGADGQPVTGAVSRANYVALLTRS